LKVCNAREVR